MGISNRARIESANENQAMKLASISKRAFDSDIDVGLNELGGPPGYDTPKAQVWFMKIMDYYTIFLDENIVGGLIVSSKGRKHRVLERIFVDPQHHRKGIGTRVFELLIERYPEVRLWTLGTPEWNVRTKHFYEKLGFIQIGWEPEPPNERGRWYQRVMDPSEPYKMITIAELEDGMKDVTVEGEIQKISASRNVKSHSTGKPLTVANADLRDDTETILLVLWNEQISQVKVGDKVRIEFGYVNSYRGINQLNVGRIGRLIILI